jgi:hypothetical protein
MSDIFFPGLTLWEVAEDHVFNWRLVKQMRKQFVLLALISALLAVVGTVPAMAGTTYEFQYAGEGYLGTGILDVNAAGLVVGLSGTQNGFAMTLLSPGAFASNDNMFGVDAPWVSENGLSFDANGVFYNIYYFATAEGYAPTGCALDATCITADSYGVPAPRFNFLLKPCPNRRPCR